MKKMMQKVVTDGTGKHAAVKGFSIGGKSGTSEPPVGRESDGYIASFIAISPIENTQVVTLVALNGLSEGANHQGGQVAGPVARQILSEVLPYLGVTSSLSTSIEDGKEELLINVPDVSNLTFSQATTKLQELGFNVKFNTDGDPNTVIVRDQVPKFGTTLVEDSVICLYESESEERPRTQVPNVKEMSVNQAINALRAKNLKIDGTKGKVVSQDPIVETVVEEGTVINVVISDEAIYSQ